MGPTLVAGQREAQPAITRKLLLVTASEFGLAGFGASISWAVTRGGGSPGHGCGHLMGAHGSPSEPRLELPQPADCAVES